MENFSVTIKPQNEVNGLAFYIIKAHETEQEYGGTSAFSNPALLHTGARNIVPKYGELSEQFIARKLKQVGLGKKIQKKLGAVIIGIENSEEAKFDFKMKTEELFFVRNRPPHQKPKLENYQGVKIVDHNVNAYHIALKFIGGDSRSPFEETVLNEDKSSYVGSTTEKLAKNKDNFQTIFASNRQIRATAIRDDENLQYVGSILLMVPRSRVKAVQLLNPSAVASLSLPNRHESNLTDAKTRTYAMPYGNSRAGGSRAANAGAAVADSLGKITDLIASQYLEYKRAEINMYIERKTDSPKVEVFAWTLGDHKPMVCNKEWAEKVLHFKWSDRWDRID